MLDFTGPFANHEPYSSVKSHFRNVKAFFEKNEKENLKEALEKLTKPDAQSYLDSEKGKLLAWASSYIATESEMLRQHIVEQALQQIETERHIITRRKPFNCVERSL